MKQTNAAGTPSQIYEALSNSALPMAGTTPNHASGYGFIQADAALALIPPGAPSLSLAASSITAGGSTTLTWSGINATGCTASGGWSGAQAVSGSRSVAPSATDTFSLTCTNAAGTSAVSTVTLNVTAAPSGGGGGAVDVMSLLGLAAWVLAGRARYK
jgi:hypothetical protein